MFPIHCPSLRSHYFAKLDLFSKWVVMTGRCGCITIMFSLYLTLAALAGVSHVSSKQILPNQPLKSQSVSFVCFSRQSRALSRAALCLKANQIRRECGEKGGLTFERGWRINSSWWLIWSVGAEIWCAFIKCWFLSDLFWAFLMMKLRLILWGVWVFSLRKIKAWIYLQYTRACLFWLQLWG